MITLLEAQRAARDAVYEVSDHGIDTATYINPANGLMVDEVHSSSIIPHVIGKFFRNGDVGDVSGVVEILADLSRECEAASRAIRALVPELKEEDE